VKSGIPAIDIGIKASARAKIANGLSALLADSYTLYLMTHNFHWNVTGPQFNSLHLMFMGQYTEQWNALDIIAERIRALGRQGSAVLLHLLVAEQLRSQRWLVAPALLCQAISPEARHEMQ
jgi:DNA-binding ferritin-like protein